jgi:selenocysteine-specific elongation factor
LCEAVRCGEKDALEQLNLLAREGRAVKTKTDIFYAPLPLQSFREKLVVDLQQRGDVTPPDFRELTGQSREIMIPLHKYFDQEKVTIRVGDKRVFRKGGRG